MRHASTSRRGYRTAVVALTTLATLVSVLWAVLTPSFRGADEPQHVNSVLRVAHGGGWPPPGEAALGPAVKTAMTEASFRTSLPGTARRTTSPPFVDAVPYGDGLRSRTTAETALPAAGARGGDQMTQHPPGYYLLGAGVLMAAGLDEARWDHQVLALRLLSVLLMVPLVPLVAATARRVTGSRAAALLAAGLPFAMPQVLYVAGTVTNDALVFTMGAVATYLSVRIVQGDMRYRSALLLGVVTGVGMMTKAFAIFIVLLVVAAYLAGRGRALLPRIARLAVAGSVAFVVGGWWWARNLLVYGEVQPGGMDSPSSSAPPESLGGFLDVALGRLAQSLWGNFAWHDVRIASPFVPIATAVLALLLVLALARRTTRELTMLVGFPVTLAAGVLAHAYSHHVSHSTFAGLQGRYLLASMVAMFVAAGAGAWRLLERSRTTAVAGILLIHLLAFAVAAYGVWVGFVGMYRADGEPVTHVLRRWVQWSPVFDWQAAILIAAIASVAVASLVLTVRAVTADEDAPAARRRDTRPSHLPDLSLAPPSSIS